MITTIKRSFANAPLGAIPHKLPKSIALFLGLYMASAGATTVSVDLNNFYIAPGAPVTVSADGSTATLSESPNFSVVLLSNIPGSGDPNVIVPGPGAMLQFDYRFNEPANNTDVFHAALLDGNTGQPFGGAFEFFQTATGAGQIQFDLSSFVGSTLGLQFELSPELSDLGYDSTLSVSNVQIVTPVPTPGGAVLMLSGALALLRAGRRGIRRSSDS
ncbi:MAG: hypothetical protein ACYC7I_02485 [Gammaproteobacteria bacterium]